MTNSTINIFLQILIAITQFFILLIPFLGSKALFDKRRRWYKKFSVRGYFLVSLALILIFLTIYQNRIVEKITIENEKIAKINLAKRDSVYRQESRAQNLSVIKLLADYGFEVKVRNEKIEKILKDSIIRKSTIINSPNPILLVENALIQKDTNNKLEIKLTLSSRDATSYSINTKLDILYLTTHSNKVFYLEKNIELFAENFKIGKDQSYFPIITIKKPTFYKAIIFHLKGQFKKSLEANSPTINLSEFNAYNPSAENTSKFGVPTPQTLNLIKEAIILNR